MQVIVVTTCSDRKKFPIPLGLDASRLRPCSQALFVETWRRRVKEASAVGAAIDVYGGRSFQEAALAAQSARADFRIISGGLGLIRGSDHIPSYSLSLVPQSEEFVGSRIVGGSFDATKWWEGVQRTASRAPLTRMLRRNPDAVAVIGISKAYLSLIESDLSLLSDDELQRVRLVGMGIAGVCSERLRPLALPYDSRLDGPDSPIPGTRGDFASRAVRHFVESVCLGSVGRSLKAHKVAVSRALAGWRPAKLLSRPTRTDAELLALIKKNWKAVEGQSGRGLRYLRDVEKVACEQGRFAALFRRVAREVKS